MHSMSKFLVICDGAVYQNFKCSAFYFFILFFIFLLCIIILFVCFILSFALLSFYVSLHYVLPALQFNCACFNSAISWRIVLVVEEAGVPGENHRPWASNW